MLVDNDDFVIYSTDARQIGSRFTLAGEVERSTASILEGPNELVYSVPMAGLGGSIRTVAVVSRAQMEASIDQMFRQMLLLIGALGVCLLLVFVLTAAPSATPLSPSAVRCGSWSPEIFRCVCSRPPRMR